MRNSLLVGKGGRVLDVIGWNKAIELTYFRDNGNAVFALGFHEDSVRSVHDEFMVPSVLMLLGSRDRYPNSDRLSLTRRNVFIRDENTCQWCGKKLSASNGTVDHLFPTTHGGTNTWRNVVAACVDCNNEKGHMNRKEYEKKSGKKLLRNPFVPHRALLFRNYLDKDGYEDWHPYLEKFV